MEDLCTISICGLPLTPTEYTIITPIDGEEANEQAANLLCKYLNILTRRTFHAVKDVHWLRSTALHSLSGAAATTRSRTPIIVGNAIDVLKTVGFDVEKEVKHFSEENSSPLFKIQTEGGSIALLSFGSNSEEKKVAVFSAVLYLLENVFNVSFDDEETWNVRFIGRTIEIGELKINSKVSHEEACRAKKWAYAKT